MRALRKQLHNARRKAGKCLSEPVGGMVKVEVAIRANDMKRIIKAALEQETRQ